MIRSNVNMAARLSVYKQPLVDPPEETEVRRRVVDEFLHGCNMDEAASPPGRVVERATRTFVADPMGQLRRIYDDLGMEWTAEFESRARAYLASVRLPRGRSPAAIPRPNVQGPSMDPSGRKTRKGAGWSERVRARPAADRQGRAGGPGADAARCRAGGEFSRGDDGAADALLVVLLWMAFAYVVQDRHDGWIWPVGVLIGWSTIQRGLPGGIGPARALGGGLTLAVLLLAAWPVAFLEDYRTWRTHAGWWARRCSHAAVGVVPHQQVRAWAALDRQRLPGCSWAWSRPTASRHGVTSIRRAAVEAPLYRSCPVKCAVSVLLFKYGYFSAGVVAGDCVSAFADHSEAASALPVAVYSLARRLGARLGPRVLGPDRAVQLVPR